MRKFSGPQKVILIHLTGFSNKMLSSLIFQRLSENSQKHRDSGQVLRGNSSQFNHGHHVLPGFILQIIRYIYHWPVGPRRPLLFSHLRPDNMIVPALQDPTILTWVKTRTASMVLVTSNFMILFFILYNSGIYYVKWKFVCTRAFWWVSFP